MSTRPRWTTPVRGIALVVTVLLGISIGCTANDPDGAPGQPSAAPSAPDPSTAASSPTSEDADVTPPSDPPPTPTTDPVDLEDGTAAGYLASMGVPQGYGASATGGAAGDVVTVTTLADDGPGSLREAASTPGPRWIRFDLSGVIRLGPPLKVASDITIDGRGQDITISGHSIEVVGVQNVIIHNLKFDDGPTGASRDAITLLQGAHDVWIDHNSLTGSPDELISVASGATDITLSWNHFYDHGKTVLIGTREGEDNEATRVTVHHNYFDGTAERNPRLTATTVHAYNNYVRAWRNHGMSAVRGGTLLAQANVFEPGQDPDAIRARGSQREPGDGLVRALDNVILGDATIEENEADSVADPPYDVLIDEPGRPLAVRIAEGAGWQPSGGS